MSWEAFFGRVHGVANYDATEAGQMLVEYAHKRQLDSTIPPPQCVKEFLAAFTEIAEKAGLSVERNHDYLRIACRSREIFLRADKDGEIALCEKKEGNGFEILEVRWNPFLAMYEGKTPDPVSKEEGYRKPRRSALAVLAEAVIKRLER